MRWGNLSVPIFLVLAVALAPVGGRTAAEPRVIDLAVHSGALPEAQRVIRVRQGDEVTLRWTTDQVLTIHLHGYDIEKTLTPNARIIMRFSARATGRFPIGVHGSGYGEEAILGYLEVHPR